jgi:hypothetical protein
VADLFGVPISQGTMATMTAKATGRLDGDFLVWLRRKLIGEKVLHVDETGLRVDGKLHWVHSVSSGKYSLVYVHPRRGKAGIDAGGVIPGYTGILVHDAWAPYDTYTGVTHVLCGAHLLRELVAAVETGAAEHWAQQAIDALVTDVAGVDQPDLEFGRLQQVERRLPIVGGCVHHDPGHAQPSQPVAHGLQRPGHRGECSHLLHSPSRTRRGRYSHTAHYLGFAMSNAATRSTGCAASGVSSTMHLLYRLTNRAGRPQEPQGQKRS